MKLLSEGWLVKDVAAALGVSRQSVSTWKAAAGRAGRRSRALAAKPQAGRPCRLSDDQKNELVRLLRAGPRKAGCDSDLWTLPRVTQLIEQKFGVSYHSTHVGRLLDALGFSCQNPSGGAASRIPSPCVGGEGIGGPP